jgi:hypothetical protein
MSVLRKESFSSKEDGALMCWAKRAGAIVSRLRSREPLQVSLRYRDASSLLREWLAFAAHGRPPLRPTLLSKPLALAHSAAAAEGQTRRS